VAAQIYKTTDEHGNIVYTDTPPASGNSTEKIKLNPTNTAPPPPDIFRPAPGDPEQPEQVNYTAEIVSPANETTIPMGPGNFSVTAKVNPAPGAGESLQLYVDGTPWGEPQAAASWALSNVFRGAHDLTVSLLDYEQVPLITSDPIRVYVLRPSIHNRNRN
jgi:hypothetical protein